VATKIINSGMIPTFKTLSGAPGRVNSGADEFSEAAPASSFAISNRDQRYCGNQAEPGHQGCGCGNRAFIIES